MKHSTGILLFKVSHCETPPNFNSTQSRLSTVSHNLLTWWLSVSHLRSFPHIQSTLTHKHTQLCHGRSQLITPCTWKVGHPTNIRAGHLWPETFLVAPNFLPLKRAGYQVHVTICVWQTNLLSPRYMILIFKRPFAYSYSEISVSIVEIFLVPILCKNSILPKKE